MTRYLATATAALLVTTVPAAAATKAATPAAALSVSRAASPATKQAHLAGQWHGIPVWGLALGGLLIAAGIASELFNTDPVDDLPDSN